MCGSVMYQQRYQTDKRKQDCYICGNYKKRTHDCTAHFIRTDLLTAGVLSNLRKVTSYAAKHEARFMKLLIEQNEDGGKRRNAARKKEMEAAEKRISELSAIFKRLYEDSVTGRISDERFTELYKPGFVLCRIAGHFPQIGENARSQKVGADKMCGAVMYQQRYQTDKRKQDCYICGKIGRAHV